MADDHIGLHKTTGESQESHKEEDAHSQLIHHLHGVVSSDLKDHPLDTTPDIPVDDTVGYVA